MKKKIIVVLVLTAMLLASCNTLTNLGIGGEPVEKEIELQEIEAEPTQAVVPEGELLPR